MTQEELFGAIQLQLDETTNPETPFVTAQRLIFIGQNLIREHGCDNRDEIVAAVMRAYENYVRPFDIPGIPNFVEPMVDRAIGKVLEDAVHRIANRICGE